MGTPLYDTDILLWSEQQAELLRRLARGERVNDIDWENLIEEVESVGRSELNSVASLLRVGLTHLLLVHAAPRSDPARRHWRAEARSALADAAARFSPSMEQRLDLDRLWRLARVTAHDKLAEEGGLPASVLETCPFAIVELVAPEPDLDDLLARLASAAPRAS
jgi:hypothetical protein